MRGTLGGKTSLARRENERIWDTEGGNHVIFNLSFFLNQKVVYDPSEIGIHGTVIQTGILTTANAR